jgi:hypothetical protein
MTREGLCSIDCRHYHKKNLRIDPIPTCDAFPNGIPDKIFWGEVFHDHPIEGDNGIQYEPRERSE